MIKKMDPEGTRQVHFSTYYLKIKFECHSKMESRKSNGEIYHLGNNQEISIKILTKEVGKLLGYLGKYKNGPIFPGSVNRRCPDIRKCKIDLNYKPKVDWRKGLEKTVSWYEKFYQSENKKNFSDFSPPDKLLF